ncbi:ABC transporter permease [Trebonia sp.]|uniref:ABC transporter permease n=1 Tax=Trebonia sp. TaxID=2767075 RepID=UPI002614FDFA|nr:ABC transporter permease [Trebonia sp.]
MECQAAFRAASFPDVLGSEWTKLRSVRSTFWALTVTVVLGVGLGAVISAAAARGYARFSASGKLSWDPTGVSQVGVAIAPPAIVVLGVLFISSEYSSGMIRTSLIAVPKRGRVLAAKSLVFAAVTVVVGEVVCFTAFFAGQALISGYAPHAALGDPGVARAAGSSCPVSLRCCRARGGTRSPSSGRPRPGASSLASATSPTPSSPGPASA